MDDVFLVVEGSVAPNCPKCGYPPKYRRDEHGVHTFSCCGVTGADARSAQRALVAWQDRAKPADVGKLWSRAMGRDVEEEQRKKARLGKLMNNGAVVKKRLNGFHDGRLMP